MIFLRTTNEPRLDRFGLRFPAGRSVVHWLPAVLIAVAIVIPTVLLGGVAHAAPGDPYVPPSETVQTPSTDDCAQRSKPPPALDTSEDVPPGAAVPTPLPVPATPVGGGRMGECGVIVPAGSPALPPDISAGSWMIADLDTGEILAAKDPHGRYRPASTLKLLTAQVMLKNLTNLDQRVKGTEADTSQDGTRVGLEAGGVYTVRQLLSYLVMISGNDAANALARTNGGYDKTVADMNATAAALGALDTRAATPSGLDGPGQSTSAYDLALFARKDMATPPFPEMISAEDVRVPGAGNDGYLAANDNQLLYQYPGALGGKTGFTDDAGNTYVGMAERDGRRLVVTMMNGNHVPRRQWMQAASLLDWGFALPVTTPPVGQLVSSLAQATGAPSPTPSTGPPTASGVSAATGSVDIASSGTAPSSGDAEPTSTTAPSTGGLPTAVIVLAGIGVLVVILGIGLLVRRRFLNKRAAFAGDAKPAGAEAQATGAEAAGADATVPPEAELESPAAGTADNGDADADTSGSPVDPEKNPPPAEQPPDAEPPAEQPPAEAGPSPEAEPPDGESPPWNPPPSTPPA